MCGRLAQYRGGGRHDFVAGLNMPNALVNSVGDLPVERYNIAPTTQVALHHLQGHLLHADMVRWGWRPNWAKERAAPINARIEKVAHGRFFRAICPHRAITAIDSGCACRDGRLHRRYHHAPGAFRLIRDSAGGPVRPRHRHPEWIAERMGQSTGNMLL